MLRHNSTIRLKEKICVNCGRCCFWFSKKRCKQCATLEDALLREEHLAFSEEDLQYLIKECDRITSIYVRKKAMDEKGIILCFTCNKEMDFYEAQCGHFIPRANLFLRFDLRNLRPQCANCNGYKRGNMAKYRELLNLEHPGLADILSEESYLVQKLSRQDVKNYINEYSSKLKLLWK